MLSKYFINVEKVLSLEKLDKIFFSNSSIHKKKGILQDAIDILFYWLLEKSIF